MNKNLFQKYFNKLIGEGILRSLFCGLIAGFSSVVVVALTCWYFSFKEIWLTITVGLAVTALVTAIFYFAKYRPNLKEIAQRIDELGLEERVLTMTELEGTDSYIARKQKEDTLKALNTVMPKDIKLRIAAAIVVALPITACVMASASTVYGLHVAGLIPSGRDVILQIMEPVPENLAVNYGVEGGGVVRGNKQQMVLRGKSASAVVAVAEEGWAFSHWEWTEDGITQVSTEPYRMDTVIEEETTFTAVFTEMEDYEEDIYGDGAGGESSGSGQKNEGGERSPFPPEGDPNGDSAEDGPPGPSGGGAGKDDSKNQYLDGETFLGDEAYDSERESGIEDTSQNDDMSDDLKDIIEDYYDTIKK